MKLFTKIKTAMIRLYENYSMTAEERYLSQSSDVVELEQRLKTLSYLKNNMFTIGGNLR